MIKLKNKSQIKILTKARGEKNVNQIWKEKNKWSGEIEKENKFKNYLTLKKIKRIRTKSNKQKN
jgi:hypothetical protein